MKACSEARPACQPFSLSELRFPWQNTSNDITHTLYTFMFLFIAVQKLACPRDNLLPLIGKHNLAHFITSLKHSHF
uniref:Uncharacterized protein n=1 Tax=Anguilla anguilla TaxID=7936 RepID=A0A0E9WJH3_ANGAN